jgi:DNA-binding SARP family transcriptional activator/tetratricopeptide (TPR) repeat protein
VRIQVLGPVRGWRDGAEIDLGATGPRGVLGLLALAAGQPVATAELVDALWPEQAPPTATNVVQTQVKRLRRLLEPTRPAYGHSTVLPTVGAGYALRLPADDVDLTRYFSLVAAAHRARVEGATPVAAELLGRGLGLWHGSPLADIPALAQYPKVVALARHRQGVLVRYGDLMIDAGAAADVLPLLAEAAAAHPLDEALHARLIRAYQAAGQRASAFEHYHDVRQRLSVDLGVDPGPELAAAHAGLLRGSASVVATTSPVTAPPRQSAGRTGAPAASIAPAGHGGATAAVPAPTNRTQPSSPSGGASPGTPVDPRPGLVVPSQLPAAVRGFTARSAELAELGRLLAETEPPNAAGMAIAAISGLPGIGKTALAVYWAHQVRGQFPDGQLYVNLRGFDPGGRSMDPAEATRQFLDALGAPAQRIPAEPEAQTALYRSMLAGRRVLILLDNAHHAAQVRPLLPGTSGCFVLVTSRSTLTGLVAAHGAHPLALDLLSPAEAQQLFVARLGSARIGAEAEAVADVVAGCARLPLALAIAAARAATQPQLRLGTLAGELSDTRARISALSGDDPQTDLRTVFSWSYTALGFEAGRLFRLLGLHPGPSITVPAAASLAARPAGQTRRLLTGLALANLLTEQGPDRYSFHDLLRSYATELVHGTDSDLDRRAATNRILDHYLHSADAADRALQGTSRHLRIALAPAQSGVTPEHPTDGEAALRWFAAERPALLAALTHAATTGFDRHSWQLAWALRIFLNRQGHWDDLAATGGAALVAARRLADPAAQVRAHRDLARAHAARGRREEAHAQLDAALELAIQAGDDVGQSGCHANLVPLLIQLGRHAEALEHARRYLELEQRAGRQAGIAGALNHLGWAHAHSGDHEQALRYCEQALALLEEVGTPNDRAATLDSLGYAHRHLGHTAEAVDRYRSALSIFRELGDLGEEATTLTTLGDTFQAAGDTAAARRSWRQALQILTDLRHPDAGQLRAKLAGAQEPATDPRHTDQPVPAGPDWNGSGKPTSGLSPVRAVRPRR